MDNNRKQIIINEIAYWKENRLLPEQYCDFLLALYTEGNGTEKKIKVLSIGKKFLLSLLFVPVIIFFIYFTELSLILQISFSIILLLIGVYLTIYFTKKGLFFQIPFIISAIIFLFVSVEWTQSIFPDNALSLYGILFMNCLIWLISGLRFKLLYFTISGILGMLLLITSYLTRIL